MYSNTNFLLARMSNLSFGEQPLIRNNQELPKDSSVHQETAEAAPDKSREINDARATLQREIKELESRTGKMGSDLAKQWKNYVENRRNEIDAAIMKSNDGTGDQQAALDAIRRCLEGLKPILAHKFADAPQKSPHTVEMTRDMVRVTVPNAGGKYKPYLRTDRGFSKNGTLDTSGRYEWNIPPTLATDMVFVGSYNDAGVATEVCIDARRSTPADIAKGSMITIDSTMPEATPKRAKQALGLEGKNEKPLSPGEQINADLSDEERKLMRRWDLGSGESTTDGEKLVSGYRRAGLRLDQLEQQFRDLKLEGAAPMKENEKTEDQKALEAVQARYAAFQEKRASVATIYRTKDNASRYVNQSFPETLVAFEQAADAYTKGFDDLQKEPGQVIAEIQRVSEQFAETVEKTSEGKKVGEQIAVALTLPADQKAEALVNGLELSDERLAIDLKGLLRSCAYELDESIVVPDFRSVDAASPFSDKLVAYDAAVLGLRETGGSFGNLDNFVQNAKNDVDQKKTPSERPQEIIQNALQSSRRSKYFQAIQDYVIALKAAKRTKVDSAVRELDQKAEIIMSGDERKQFRLVKDVTEGVFLGASGFRRDELDKNKSL